MDGLQDIRFWLYWKVCVCRLLGRAPATGEPSLSLPCYAERPYDGVMEDEPLMAIPPAFVPKVVQGLEALSANGLRFPIPSYGINNDVRAGMRVSY